MNVGFVGLGAMGGGIVRRLLAAGRPVTGWNRTRQKAEPLVEAGMAWAETPREVAAASDVVFSMLTDADAVHAAALGDDGILAGLRPGVVYADMSTILPDQSRALAQQAAEAGAMMLDAPVSGSMATLEQGQMAVMVGGDENAFERVRAVLDDIGPKVTYLGGNGSALVVKLAIKPLPRRAGHLVLRERRARREVRGGPGGGRRRDPQERDCVLGRGVPRAAHPHR